MLCRPPGMVWNLGRNPWCRRDLGIERAKSSSGATWLQMFCPLSQEDAEPPGRPACGQEDVGLGR